MKIVDAPPVVDIELYGHDTPTVGFVLPVDLTGADVTFSAKVGDELLFTQTRTTGLTVIENDPEVGRSTVKLGTLSYEGRGLAAFPGAGARYDLEVKFPGGTVRTYLRGQLTLTEDAC